MKKIHSTDAAPEIERDALSLGTQQVTSLATATSIAAITGTAERLAGIASGKFVPHPSIVTYQPLPQEFAKSLYPSHPHTVGYRIGGPATPHSVVAESVHKALVPEDQILRDIDILSAFSTTSKTSSETAELPDFSPQTAEPRFNVALHGLEGFDSSGLEVDDEHLPALPDWPATMRKVPYVL